MLHTFLDGSVLRKIGVRELIHIPVWKGNRHIDLQHATQIQKEVGDNITVLDSTIFRVVQYNDDGVQQTYLIDGQHRQYVLRKYFEENMFMPTFDVLVVEKKVEEESDAIEYFNTLNNVKPQFENDTKLLANKYINALLKVYNKTKGTSMIRPEGKATRRPFLSSDALRAGLEEHGKLLKQSKECIQCFLERVEAWNKKKLAECEIQSLYMNQKNKQLVEACLEKKFVLALDPKLPWIYECLQ